MLPGLLSRHKAFRGRLAAEAGCRQAAWRIMRLRLEQSGDWWEPQPMEQLGSGGEARIYRLPGEPPRVAKLWHKPTEERARKVAAMIANPPVDPMTGQGHVAIAWPIERLVGEGRAGRVLGFVMPRVEGMRPIIDFFNPRTRLRVCPLFNWFYLHRTARNLVIAIRALHERGYVVGDLNESNILVSERALVTLVDTDSFQVWDAEAGVLYRCRVGRPEFTPPELQGKSFARVNRGPEQDRFGVATLVFQLLMEGTHPFAGVYHGRGEAPVYAERIAAGHFPHLGSAHVPYSPSPAAPRFEWLHPVLQDLFVRCFHDGHLDPSLRPDMISWQYALEEAEAALASCHLNPQHVFSNHLGGCPWCERKAILGGRDPFPSVEAVRRKEHLRPPPSRPKRPVVRPAAPWPTAHAALGTGLGAAQPPLPPPIPRRGHPGSGPRRRGAGAHFGSTPSSRRFLSPEQIRVIQQAFSALRRNEWAWWAAAASGLAGLSLMWSAFRIGSLVLASLGVLLGVIGE